MDPAALALDRWHERGIVSPVLGYGFSIVGVAIALGLALICQEYGFRDVSSPLFDVAIVLTAWYCGIGPSVVAVVLAATAFNYYFTEPLYSFEVTPEDLPYFFIFAGWAVLVAWFVIIRRRIEERLRQRSWFL